MKVTDVVYTPIAETEDFQHVVGVELGGGYNWNSLQAWWSPSKRRFFWLAGSGCSCNYLGQDVSLLSDFTSGNRSELVNAVRLQYEGAYNASVTDALNDIAAVKKWRAEP